MLQEASGKTGEGVFSSGASTPSVAESKVRSFQLLHIGYKANSVLRIAV